MQTPRVLIVEDDRELAGMVAEFLATHGLGIAVSHNGLDAVERIRGERFDALVLDIGLPGLDGLEVCRQVRPLFDGPILILTARGEEMDEVVALEIGADDYMAKPVRPRALLARLKVHLKRNEHQAEASPTAILEVGQLAINPACREVTLRGTPIELSTAEFDLLESLALQAGSVVARADIYERLNGIRYDGLDRSIDLRVSRLRKKLGDDPQNPTLIKSVRGVGYILIVKT